MAVEGGGRGDGGEGERVGGEEGGEELVERGHWVGSWWSGLENRGMLR